MSNYVNKIITKDKEKYNINDSRIPSPTPNDKGKVLGVNRKGELDFIKLGTGSGDAIGLVNGEIEEFESDEPLRVIRPYMFNELQNITSINLNGTNEDVGYKAINHCDNLDTLNLGIINGRVEDYAFCNLIKVSNFSIDPESNITELGKECFSGLGMQRNSAERFYIDLRNSTFKNFQGFGNYDQDATSTWDGTIIPAIPGVGLYNTEIRLPATVESFEVKSISGNTAGSSSGGGILSSSENVDLYITGKEVVIPLTSIDKLPSDEQSHIYVPVEILGKYKMATNWAALDNLYGYVEDGTFPAGQLLPTQDDEGFEITWYSDKKLQNIITRSNGKEMYCEETFNRVSTKIILTQAIDATISIRDLSGRSYEPNELIPLGREVIIKAIPNTTEDVLTLFKVGGDNYTQAGEADIILNDYTVYVSVVCNVQKLPSYLSASKTYDWVLRSDVNALYVADKWNLPSEAFFDYTYIVNNKVMSFDNFSGVKGSPWDQAPSQLIKAELKEGYQILSQGAFCSCYNLSHVILPSSLKYISYMAFSNCSNLTIVEGGQNVEWLSGYAFCSCSRLSSVNFPKVSYISGNAFSDCSALTSISFPEVVNIGWGAFSNCTSLSEVSFEKCVYINGYAFAYCSNLETASFPNCETIDYEAFSNCSKLTNIYFPKVSYIGSRAFANCSWTSGTLNEEIFPNLTKMGSGAFAFTYFSEVNLPSLTSLESYVFANCYNLSSINLPNVIKIGSFAFSNCTSLSEVNFLETLVLETGAFCYCNNLKQISFPKLEEIRGSAYGESPFYSCMSLTSLSFPELQIVDNYAFRNNSQLNSVYIPKCKKIKISAFENCYNLNSVYTPVCEYIGEKAFQNCYNLKSLSFPVCQKIDGGYAFGYCSKLESVYLLTSKVPELLENDWYGLNPFTYTPITNSDYLGHYGSIYVKESLANAFKKAAGWKEYSNRIVGLTDEEINNL